MMDPTSNLPSQLTTKQLQVASQLEENQQPNRVFYRVGGGINLEKMEIVSEIFHRILTPLYGSQEKAIRQIEESSDRHCYLLCNEEFPAGILMFKTVLTNEFAEYGITNSVEIKSLFVDNAAQNSGRGLGSCLIDKLKEEVSRLALGENGIHVTVSETKEDSLAFFKKKNFSIVHAWKDRYLPGVTEYLLFCPTRIHATAAVCSEQKDEAAHQLLSRNLSATVFSTPPRSNRNSILKQQAVINESNSSQKIAQVVRVISNAHVDDIHTLTKLSDQTFISGSKDNSLVKWSFEGEKLCVVDEVEPDLQSERNWITAVKPLNDDYWLSGQRDGKISLWRTNGEFVREIKMILPKLGSHQSLPYNARRVTCLAASLDRMNPSFFVGFPTIFNEFNLIEGRTIASHSCHSNDWMYCIHPLTKKQMIGVVGATVTLWDKNNGNWSISDTLLQEGRKVRTAYSQKAIRPFISDLTPIVDSQNLFGLATLTEKVAILDINSKNIIQEWNEHQGRVWSVHSINQETLISSGEDRSIKLWDRRISRSVNTIRNRIGQVTATLPLSEHLVVAGACPEGVLKSYGDEGAQIIYYDLRK